MAGHHLSLVEVNSIFLYSMISFYWKLSIEFDYNFTIRYRYTPVYVFILLFNATFLFKCRAGPSWPILADVERIACRKNWWTNLLYINNFVKSDEPVKKQKCSIILNTHIIWLEAVFIMLCIYLLIVFATCMVFGGRFSTSHSWHNHSNDYLEVYKIDENRICNSFCNFIFHSSRNHLSL